MEWRDVKNQRATTRVAPTISNMRDTIIVYGRGDPCGRPLILLFPLGLLLT